MKKMLILLLLITPLFSQDNINDYYQKIDGLWKSPNSGELDVFFTIEDGDFTISLIPIFEYDKLSSMKQKQIIQDNIKDSSGYFEFLKILKEPSNQHGTIIKSIIFLNEELSTNHIEITKDEIFIYDIDSDQKNIFAERIKK